MAAIVRRHACTLFGVVTLLLWVMWAAIGADYDAGGAATALFLLTYFLCAPFLAAAGVAGAVLGDSAFAPILWIPLGFVPYILADWLRRHPRQAGTNSRAV